MSTDHFFSPVTGRLLESNTATGYKCGSIFVDHASGRVFVYPQFSSDAPETIDNKHRLEAEAAIDGVHIRKYHSDNGTFASKAIKEDCKLQSQTYDFSAPYAQFQNGVAERGIQTAIQWAQANLLHVALHWPARSNPRLWPFALKYAVWVFNRLPSLSSGICPLELWTGERQAHDKLRRAHAFGCPVFVLDSDIADGKKILKWHPRA